MSTDLFQKQLSQPVLLRKPFDKCCDRNSDQHQNNQHVERNQGHRQEGSHSAMVVNKRRFIK